MRTGAAEAEIDRCAQQQTARRIQRWVGVAFYLASFVVFRDVLFGIPAILAGDAVVNGDELVPFFNPTSQLFEQARGDFSPLTNGFEFRVRYSFLTTWLRHYQVLPFALLFGIPTIFWVAYLTVAKFVTNVFRTLSPVAVALAAAFPTALLYSIVTYAKITHFYTLIAGLALMTIAVLLMLYGLLFAADRWVRYALGACLVTVLNPAVHYVVLFGVFFAVAGAALAVAELARWISRGGPGLVRSLPRRAQRVLRSRYRIRLLRRMIRGSVLGRGVVAGLVFLLVTVIPYGLFVKFVALRGVENLAVTVPGDFYFIRDASVSWLHVLSWDLAGIMDKILFGDYLAKTPRYPNIVYSLLMVAPIALPPMRRTLLATRPHRRLFGVITATGGFAVWATIGYAEPHWFPTFHRSIAALANLMAGTPLGDVTLEVSSTVVQVLRFPHRFQLILFVLAPVVMTLGLAWTLDALSRHWRAGSEMASATGTQRGASGVLQGAATLAVAAAFFAPFWSNANYREVFGSGDFGQFAAPFPVADLQELKQELTRLPQGKTVVLPPTEAAKLVTDANGVDHKFNDKFYIYYLDQPSFYYGLTGAADNKFEFFLILRGIYYQQDWWINPARDIGIRYLIVNKEVRDNKGVGAEYLPDVETYIGPALQRQQEMGFAELRFENETYALYELIYRAAAERETLLIDSSWSEYLDLVFDRLDLSLCYDFEYLPYYEPGDEGPVHLFSPTPAAAALDLYSLRGSFFPPSSRGLAFNPEVVTSAYYQSPMFRLFLFLSNTRWNRTEMITPGLFGTLRGTFSAIPRSTSFAVPVAPQQPGRFRVLLRGAATANRLDISAPSLEYQRSLEVRAETDAVQYFTAATVYSSQRVAVDSSQMSVEELETRVGADLVPVNVRYGYHDLGSVEMSPGAHTFTIRKLDHNPMLVEGLVLIPEAEYRTLALPGNVTVVESIDELGCSQRYPVVDNRKLSYVDPAANPEHQNLSNEELLSLAAAGVAGLEADDSGGLRHGWLALLAILLGAAAATFRSSGRNWTAPGAEELDED